MTCQPTLFLVFLCGVALALFALASILAEVKHRKRAKDALALLDELLAHVWENGGFSNSAGQFSNETSEARDMEIVLHWSKYEDIRDRREALR